MTNRRIEQLQLELRRKHLNALVVSSLPNIRYLTGFSGSNALLIFGSRRCFFITDSRYTLQSKDEVRGWKRIITTRPLLEEASRKGLLAGCKRVGFESAHTSVAQYRLLRRLFRNVSFVETTSLVEDTVLCKEGAEVDSIRAAAKITDAVFREMTELITDGVTEGDVAAEISFRQKRMGAEGDSFEPIVASGPRSALPHARPTGKKIRRGEFVVLDFGCVKNGYNSDLTRTIAVGHVSRRMREMYQAVKEAQQAAIDAARGGMMASDLDAVARKHIESRGFGKYFTHALGHGLGLSVHEAPRISSLSKDRLRTASVVTIEPGVYIPGVGGVRIEDDIVLTDRGCRILTKSPKELIVV